MKALSKSRFGRALRSRRRIKPYFMDGPMLLRVTTQQALCRDCPGQHRTPGRVCTEISRHMPLHNLLNVLRGL